MNQARRRIAWRLLPFVFVLYLICMIDRFNISFAALRMKADLGFSDSVYGFGASLFFLTYVALEIPGAIVAERWSIRKWIARIMVSWGLITVATASIQSAHQFYIARLLLGAAEASFFPAVIIYVTRWFTLKDRARAIAAFYAASAVSTILGSAIASWLLRVHWMGDQPSEAAWLPEAERSAIVTALATEHAAKARLDVLRFWDACKDARLRLLVTGYFFYIMSVVTNTLWMSGCRPSSSGFRTCQQLPWQD